MKQLTGNAFHYGWVIIAIAALSQFFSGPGQTYSNSIFIDYYIEEFGWSRSTVSGIYSAATLTAGFMLFFVGRLIDRNGSRKMAVTVSIALAVACFFNSFVTSLVMLFIGFFFIRLLGQGSMALISSSLIPQWFVKKRGRAISIAAIGGLVSSAAFPLLNVWLIEAFGWRSSWLILGAIIVVCFTPLALFLIQNSPEEMGLLPDNGEILKNKLPKKEAVEVSWAVKEASKTRAFWLLLLCAAIPGIVNTGLTFHLVSIFAEKSLSLETAAGILSLTALIGLPITFITGILLEKVKVQYMLAVVFAGELFSILLLQKVDVFAGAVIFGLVWGISMGIERIVMAVVWPNYFGRKHIGSLSGIAMAMVVTGSALGPLPLGIAFDFFGGYVEILWILMIFPAFGMLAALLAHPPVKQDEGIQKRVDHTNRPAKNPLLME
ncbi:MFS transporter [Planococcus donghaensis]|uniref:MFS transporter n=1 Tax=Planococcus donghaensis TaxID=414778 RepID=A0A1C7EDK1_9BACL|nr:MFS transporter [Planococcus donghaensis]ANU21950.1 MFS transporter [Planococcus donghaensis]